MPDTEVANQLVLMERDSEPDVAKEQSENDRPEQVENQPPCDGENEASSDTVEQTDENTEVSDESPRPRIDISPKKSSLAEIDFVKEAKNRVKLYVLCDQRVWDDRGTGHVTCVPLPEQPSIFCIVVQLEAAEKKNVLESKILVDTAYQKQQETLIVWSENESCDLALSFQEKSGCEEIWSKICEVQGRDPEEGYDDLDDGDASDSGQASAAATQVARGGTVALPPCEMSRLPEIEVIFANHTQSAALREKIANTIESEGYLTKMCDVFQMCEDIENAEGLRTFFSIARHMFHLNRNNVIDLLFAEEHVKSVLGMLEYDPTQTEPRKHREFLFEKTNFKDVLKIEREELRDKIRHAYVVQYVQDVCFPAPSIFEENLLSVLNSHLFFVRVEIVSMLMEEKVLKELFSELRDPECETSRRTDLVKFLRELCSFSHALQNNGPNSREQFFKTLMQNDVLGTIEPCIRSSNAETRATIIEVLNMLVEYNPQTVRDYVLRQSRDRKEDEILLNLLIRHMFTDRDAELSSAKHVAQVMRTLLDPDNMVAHKSEKSEFLAFFYRKCVSTLVKPILENVADGKLKKDDYYTANVACLVVRLLCFCVEHHSYNMRSYCLSSGLLSKVLVLLQSKHHFLSLSALKMLRGVIALKDDFYIRDILKNGVIDKVVDCFIANGPRYNLLNSAVIELFDFIRQEDLKSLIKYTVEKHWPVFEKVKYVKVFADMKRRHEMYANRERPLTAEESKESVVDIKASKERAIDAEEQWFSNEDEEDEEPPKETKEKERVDVPSRKTAAEPNYPSVVRNKPDDDDDEDSLFIGSTLKKKSMIRIVSRLGSTSPSGSPNPSSSNADRSRSPSPSSQNGEDEVSSSQPGSKESSPQAASTALRTLSEYGDSDSDPEEEEDDQSNSSDGIPTSDGDSRDSPEDGVSSTSKDDVSSTTSGMKRRRTESPEPELPTQTKEPVEKKQRALSPPPLIVPDRIRPAE